MINSLIILLSMCITACSGGKVEQSSPNSTTVKNTTAQSEKVRVMFYNIENLFDTLDDPNNPRDNEYLPESGKEWTQARYEKKLKDLKKVINLADTPDLIGLSEVENKKVVEDLAATIGEKEWGVVHNDSPDERGIDVAFIYNKKIMKVKNTDFINVQLPKVKNEKGQLESDFTREILYVEGMLNKEKVHIFVNHWPSRRNPDEFRMNAASELEKRTEKILAKDADANIIIMGDLNDEPNNKSLTVSLKAKNPKSKIEKAALYNLSYPLFQNQKGTYNYKGNINMLDQIIVSGNMLLPDEKINTKYQDFKIVQEDFMIYKHPEYGNMANRTFGREYYGGISDHFPVYIDLYLK